MAERERQVAEREAEFSNLKALTESERVRIERQDRRLTEIEEELGSRTRELETREAETMSHAAQLEAELELREAHLSKTEAELEELKARLARKEEEIAAYVGQVQRAVNRNDTPSWRLAADGA